MNIPYELMKYRAFHNLSQRELAKLVGVCKKTITRWETGRTKPHRYMVIGLQLADILPREVDRG
jgi:DNA-binding XRE family transcriptional regulator